MWNDIDKRAVLEWLGETRADCIKFCPRAVFERDVYSSLEGILHAIDAVAEVLTGDS